MPKGIKNIENTKFYQEKNKELNSNFYEKLKNDLFSKELYDKHMNDILSANDDYLNILMSNPKRTYTYNSKNYDSSKKRIVNEENRGKYYYLMDNMYFSDPKTIDNIFDKIIKNNKDNPLLKDNKMISHLNADRERYKKQIEDYNKRIEDAVKNNPDLTVDYVKGYILNIQKEYHDSLIKVIGKIDRNAYSKWFDEINIKGFRSQLEHDNELEYSYEIFKLKKDYLSNELKGIDNQKETKKINEKIELQAEEEYLSFLAKNEKGYNKFKSGARHFHKDEIKAHWDKVEKGLQDTFEKSELLKEYVNIPNPVSLDDTNGDARLAYKKNETEFSKIYGKYAEDISKNEVILKEVDRIANESKFFTSDDLLKWIKAKQYDGILRFRDKVDPEYVNFKREKEIIDDVEKLKDKFSYNYEHFSAYDKRKIVQAAEIYIEDLEDAFETGKDKHNLSLDKKIYSSDFNLYKDIPEKDEDFIKWMKAHRFEMISYEAFANGKIKLDDNAEVKNAYEERKSLTNAIKNYALARLKVIKDPFAEFTDNELKKAYEDELEKYNTIQVEKIDAEKKAKEEVKQEEKKPEAKPEIKEEPKPDFVVDELKAKEIITNYARPAEELPYIDDEEHIKFYQECLKIPEIKKIFYKDDNSLKTRATALNSSDLIQFENIVSKRINKAAKDNSITYKNIDKDAVRNFIKFATLNQEKLVIEETGKINKEKYDTLVADNKKYYEELEELIKNSKLLKKYTVDNYFINRPRDKGGYLETYNDNKEAYSFIINHQLDKLNQEDRQAVNNEAARVADAHPYLTDADVLKYLAHKEREAIRVYKSILYPEDLDKNAPDIAETIVSMGSIGNRADEKRKNYLNKIKQNDELGMYFPDERFDFRKYDKNTKKWIDCTGQIGSENKNIELNLFPNGEPSRSDVFQVNNHACYFLAPLGSVAENRKDLIKDMVKDNGDGTATVTFYCNGPDNKKVPFKVRVDKTLPALDSPSAPWVNIVEKAYAASRLATTGGEMPSLYALNKKITLDNVDGGQDWISLQALLDQPLKYDNATEAFQNELEKYDDMNEAYRALGREILSYSGKGTMGFVGWGDIEHGFGHVMSVVGAKRIKNEKDNTNKVHLILHDQYNGNGEFIVPLDDFFNPKRNYCTLSLYNFEEPGNIKSMNINLVSMVNSIKMNVENHVDNKKRQDEIKKEQLAFLKAKKAKALEQAQKLEEQKKLEEARLQKEAEAKKLEEDNFSLFDNSDADDQPKEEGKQEEQKKVEEKAKEEAKEEESFSLFDNPDADNQPKEEIPLKKVQEEQPIEEPKAEIINQNKQMESTIYSKMIEKIPYINGYIKKPFDNAENREELDRKLKKVSLIGEKSNSIRDNAKAQAKKFFKEGINDNNFLNSLSIEEEEYFNEYKNNFTVDGLLNEGLEEQKEYYQRRLDYFAAIENKDGNNINNINNIDYNIKNEDPKLELQNNDVDQQELVSQNSGLLLNDLEAGIRNVKDYVKPSLDANFNNLIDIPINNDEFLAWVSEHKGELVFYDACTRDNIGIDDVMSMAGLQEDWGNIEKLSDRYQFAKSIVDYTKLRLKAIEEGLNESTLKLPTVYDTYRDNLIKYATANNISNLQNISQQAKIEDEKTVEEINQEQPEKNEPIDKKELYEKLIFHDKEMFKAIYGMDHKPQNVQEEEQALKNLEKNGLFSNWNDNDFSNAMIEYEKYLNSPQKIDEFNQALGMNVRTIEPNGILDGYTYVDLIRSLQADAVTQYSNNIEEQRKKEEERQLEQQIKLEKAKAELEELKKENQPMKEYPEINLDINEEEQIQLKGAVIKKLFDGMTDLKNEIIQMFEDVKSLNELKEYQGNGSKAKEYDDKISRILQNRIENEMDTLIRNANLSSKEKAFMDNFKNQITLQDIGFEYVAFYSDTFGEKEKELKQKELDNSIKEEKVQNEEVIANEKAEYINKIVNMESAQKFIFGNGYENEEKKNKYVSNPVNDLKGNHANNYKEKTFKNVFTNIKSDAEKVLGENVFDKYDIQPLDIYNKLQEIQQAYLENNLELKAKYAENLENLQKLREKVKKIQAEEENKKLEAKQNPVVEENPIVQPVQNNPIQGNNLEENKQEVIQENKPEIINPNKVIVEQEFNQPVKELSVDQIKAFKDELIRLVDRINKSHSSKQENSDAYKKLKANLSNFKNAHKNDAMTAADFKAKLAGFEEDANKYLQEHTSEDNVKYKTCGKARQERIKTCARIKAMNALLNKGIPYDSHNGKIVMLASKIVCAEAINKGYDGFTELCGEKAIENAIQHKLNDEVFLKKAGFIAKNKAAYDKLVKMSGSNCLELFNKQPAEAKKVEEAKDNVQKQDNEAEFNSMFR